jgi:hypothetical protein
MSTLQLERIEDYLRDARNPWPGRACCCAAQPVVRVVFRSIGGVDHEVDLFLCGHHYRASRASLSDAGARVIIHDSADMDW